MASSRTVANKVHRLKEGQEQSSINVPKCAIIARVSLDRQSESVGHQVAMLREYAKARGYGEVIEDYIYEETGVSASKYSMWERPGMRRLIVDAKAGLFQVVMFKGISRFARNTEEALSVLDRLKSQGLRVISMEENYDSNKHDSNFMFTIYAAMAEHEAEKTGIRVRLGNKAKATSGLWCGTPPDGYKLVDRKLIPDEVRKPIIEKIFELYDNGQGSRNVAYFLNKRGWLTSRGGLWCSKTVRDVLCNEAYIGKTVYNKTNKRRVRDYESDIEGKKKWKTNINPEEDWVIKEGTHEPLIDLEVFERVNRTLDSKRFKKDAPNVYHPLTGILFCGSCGQGMVCQKRSTPKKEYRYYICKTYHKYGRDYCKQANINADDLEQDIMEALGIKLRDYLNKQKKHKVAKKDLEGLRVEKELAEVRRKIDMNNKLTGDLYFEKAKMTEIQYEAVAKRLRDESEQLNAQLIELEHLVADKVQRHRFSEEVAAYVEEFFKFDHKDVAKLRELLHFFIDRIDATNDRIKVKYRFEF